MRFAVDVRDAPAAKGPYSHAIAANGLLFCSGQLPLDPGSGHLVTGDVEAQLRRCLENLRLVCVGAGARIEDAAHLTVYLVDLNRLSVVNGVFAEHFADQPPARTTVEVAALPTGAAIEIDAVVALTVECERRSPHLVNRQRNCT